jgi:hypothetical protein
MTDVSFSRRQPGDVVVLRLVETPTSAAMVHAFMGDPAEIRGYPFMANGRIVTVQARPDRVVADTGAGVALFQPAGTLLPRWLLEEQRYLPEPQSAPGDSLRLLFPDRPYDVTLFFETDAEPSWFYDAFFGDGLQAGWRERRRSAGGAAEPPRAKGTPGRFRGWYVNLQSPFRRMPYGFDIVDLTLDIVARPDRSWYLKDVDELDLAVSTGACTQALADALHRAATEVVALIESAASPFDEIWTAWRPPPGWAIDTIPDGWQDSADIQDAWWSLE